MLYILYIILNDCGFVFRFGFLPDLERNGHDNLNSTPSPQQNDNTYHVCALHRECSN